MVRAAEANHVPGDEGEFWPSWNDVRGRSSYRSVPRAAGASWRRSSVTGAETEARALYFVRLLDLVLPPDGCDR
jgi:hypothetical protein